MEASMFLCNGIRVRGKEWNAWEFNVKHIGSQWIHVLAEQVSSRREAVVWMISKTKGCRV